MAGAISERHRKVLPLLVLDSTMMKFENDEKAKEYVCQRLGRDISLRTYRRYLDRVESGEFASEWYADYAVRGYSLERIKLLSTAYMIRSRVLTMLEDEANEKITPKWERDKRLEVQLMGELRAASEMIAQLNSTTSVIAEIDARFTAYEKQIQEQEQTIYKLQNKEVLAQVEGHG